MRNRVAFSIAVTVVLLASTNASGSSVTGTVSDGIFSAPVPACVAPVVCTGQGTNTFSWGAPFQIGGASSSLQATGVAFTDQAVGPQFVIGHLFFRNAETIGGTEVTNVQLQITNGDVFVAGSSPPTVDPIHNHEPFAPLNLGIVNTPNTTNPEDSADIIQILSGQHCNPPCTDKDKNGNTIFDEFHVLEGHSATVELLGYFGSAVFVGYGQVDDPTSAFVSSSAVPEPSSLALICGGLIYLVLAVQRTTLRRHRLR